MASEGYHEPLSELDAGVVDRHRMITSIMEELEAVDWYDQRVAATSDESLAAVLAHNRDEEKEHAAMGIEWLRRNDAYFDDQLRTYLFTELPITEVEDVAESAAEDGRDSEEPPGSAEAPTSPDTTVPSLGIGSLKHTPTEDHR